MKDININQEKKIRIADKSEKKTLELGTGVIDRGFLKNFPGPDLALIIYLLTHINDNLEVYTHPSQLTTYLPYSSKEIKQTLNKLEAQNIIDITENEDKNDDLLKIRINPGQLQPTANKEVTQKLDVIQGKDAAHLRQKIIHNQIIEKSELKKALLSFVPPDKKPASFENKVEGWLKDFQPRLLCELIRRVEKWFSRRSDNQAEKEAFYYLQGIVNDWYEKDIYTYKRLKYFDWLYRETKDMAQTYGIKWHNLKPAQLETFRQWLIDGFSLSPAVVKFAIKEATRRKKDGEPSLKYIEDNFIKPWKEAEVKTITQAREELSTRNKKKKNNNTEKESPLRQWDSFYWDEL